MKFVIEPAQTYWNSDGDGVVKCRLRVPKGSVVLAMEANHLLVKRPVLESIATNGDEDHEWIGLIGLQLGVELDGDVRVGVFLGVLRLTHTMASYAVFATTSKSTLNYEMHVAFNVGAGVDLEKAIRASLETIPPGKLGA